MSAGTTIASRIMVWRLPSGDDVVSLAAARAIAERVDDVLESWRDTPYVPGQQCKGVGVDCIRFGAGVLDELDGRRRIPPARLPQDVALHNPKIARNAMKAFLRGYSPNEAARDEWVEPGDMIVTANGGGGPGHLEIVGGREGTIWHANKSRVKQKGWGFERDGQQRIVAVYRFRERWRWIEGARPEGARPEGARPGERT